MDNQFLIHFREINDAPRGGNFAVSINNPIEIQDIENEDNVLKAVKSFSVMEMKNANNMANAKKVHFDITDSKKKNMFYFGEGMINKNQIDIIKIESLKL